MKRRICTLVALMALSVPAWADEEAANVSHVAIDAFGRCYAKSVPTESYGSAGTTKVYAVDAGEDRLVDSYSWYAGTLHLQCLTRLTDGRNAVSIVQFGPWARGRAANRDQLAVAFHAGGRLLRSYSTLDIAGAPDNVAASISHYTVFRDVEGFVTADGKTVFRMTTVDNRRLTFDPGTGNLLERTDIAGAKAPAHE